MQFLNSFKKNRIVLATIAVLIFILFAFTTILYLDNGNLINSFSGRGNSTTNPAGLVGYDNLKKEITSLISKDSAVSKNPNFQKVLAQINSLENTKLSKDKKFNILEDASEYLVFAYVETANHNLYTLEEILDKFMRTNFPEKGLPNIKPACFDPSCAQNSQPEKILAVIEEIKNSDIPDYLKENDTANLITFGYLNDDSSSSLKANNYLDMAEVIKKNELYTRAGINLKIYDQINEYVKNKYPKEYEKFQISKSQNQ